MGKRLKNRDDKKGQHIQTPNTEHLKPLPELEYPMFCFRYMDKEYHLDKCQKDEKVAFIQRLVKLSQEFTWKRIQQEDKHHWGSEKIEWNALKNRKCPPEFTEDEILLALRFQDKKPFLGVKRQGGIFHLLYIDRDFSLYDHGS